jgi:hypothetical protein
MIYRCLLALIAAATWSTNSFAHDESAHQGTAPAGSEIIVDPANPGHVHIRTPGPSPVASTGVSSPDDEDYGSDETATGSIAAHPPENRNNAAATENTAAVVQPIPLKPVAVAPVEKIAVAAPPKVTSAPTVKAKTKPLTAKSPAKPKPTAVATAAPAKKPLKKKKPAAKITSIY